MNKIGDIPEILQAAPEISKGQKQDMTKSNYLFMVLT
jgi:hypothetical protein